MLVEVASTPDHGDEPVIAIRSGPAGWRWRWQVSSMTASSIDSGLCSPNPLVRELGAQELVIDLSEARACEPDLARFLHRVRLRRQAAGCRVELRNPSEALGVGLEDATLSEAFTVYDAARRHNPH
ncbi:hypothetical protein [Actinomycetospora soli]|uniref:hypothetical protein n=1 Tax=Actinomycetospora soli TaxID=2893887 RepID=UPI001E5EC5D9|nr:hypothetical protein [Actinomycetospora soli]MCD2191257.1 hypothetical protein [Actinomycetospora soli]